LKLAGGQQLLGTDSSVHVNFDTRKVAMIEPRHPMVLSAVLAKHDTGSAGVVPTTKYDAALGEARPDSTPEAPASAAMYAGSYDVPDRR
jgi:hypothetical protein